jgi:hypothetical protein
MRFAASTGLWSSDPRPPHVTVFQPALKGSTALLLLQPTTSVWQERDAGASIHLPLSASPSPGARRTRRFQNGSGISTNSAEIVEVKRWKQLVVEPSIPRK